jgi:rhodanese-related sulfurtransferase
MPSPHAIPTVTADQVPVPVPDSVVVVDVREDDEWQAGHIDGARHIPLMQLPERLGELADATSVLCVCRVGARSARATMLLRHTGVDAMNLHGGMNAWASAGKPMVSETEQVPEVR